MNYLIVAIPIGAALVVAHRLFRKRKAEPPELVGVAARLHNGPKDRSGAVALEEPDDDAI
jgi:hypothetical protein